LAVLRKAGELMVKAGGLVYQARIVNQRSDYRRLRVDD
jgi:hypothetical protein